MVGSTIFSKFRIPLREITGEFTEVIKRIKEVKFWPDQVVIKLVSDHPAVRTSVLMPNIRVIGINGTFPYVSKEIDLSHDDIKDFVYYDKSLHAIIIPIRGVKKIIFMKEKRKKIFSKK